MSLPITAMLEENFKNSHEDIFYCTRVQEAWEVGTMTRDDFTPFVETELYSEIIEEISTLEEEQQKKAKEEENARVVGILEEIIKNKTTYTAQPHGTPVLAISDLLEAIERITN